jgi:hypothetical protein
MGEPNLRESQRIFARVNGIIHDSSTNFAEITHARYMILGIHVIDWINITDQIDPVMISLEIRFMNTEKKMK